MNKLFSGLALACILTAGPVIAQQVPAPAAPPVGVEESSAGTGSRLPFAGLGDNGPILLTAAAGAALIGGILLLDDDDDDDSTTGTRDD